LLETKLDESPVISIPSLAEALKVSVSTTQRALEKCDYKKVKPILLPPISPDIIQKRLEYCKLHKTDNFSNVFFSDEAMIQLQDNRTMIWKNANNLTPTINQLKKNTKIMIWTAISRKGKTKVRFWHVDNGETCNAENYRETLKNYCIPKGNSAFGKSKWRFEIDNARPYVATIVLDFLKEQNVTIAKHPPYSPDLNPIEKV